jgi:hypothetical protein
MMTCYVTASCTDGCTYVWDSAEEDDLPIHVLRHGGEWLPFAVKLITNSSQIPLMIKLKVRA